MPKKVKKVFYEKLTFENFLAAHKRARKNKAYKHEIIKYELNLENNLINLIHKLKSGNYKLGEYREFKVLEPKERIIKSLPYNDRIVHQWYVEEFIKPYITPKFIYKTYACLENKGTHNAVSQLQQDIRKFKRNYGDFWILKCDIKKFFYSINTDVLFDIIKRYFTDKKFLELTKVLIYGGKKVDEIVGIPIGNYTSQFFANIYLNELDQYIKRNLKLKYYIRYMDDFIVLVKSKEECKEIKNKIIKFLYMKLKLELNQKSKYFPYKMGVDFCGYRVFNTHRLLRNSSKRRIKNKVKKWNKLYSNGRLDILKAIQSINAWVGHAKHSNSYHLQKNIINKCNFIFK